MNVFFIMDTHIKSAISLKPFDPKYQDEVKQLILEGLGEHWGTIDPSKNPDLDDIGKTYIESEFILAWHNRKIVGTGALVSLNRKTSKIVRMSVKKEYRRRGIGKFILDHLISLASRQGHTSVILETTKTWTELIDFYISYGFQSTHYENGDVFFEYRIGEQNLHRTLSYLQEQL